MLNQIALHSLKLVALVKISYTEFSKSFVQFSSMLFVVFYFSLFFSMLANFGLTQRL